MKQYSKYKLTFNVGFGVFLTVTVKTENEPEAIREACRNMEALGWGGACRLEKVERLD